MSIGAGCQTEKDLELSPSPRTVQKIPGNYCTCLYLSLANFGDWMSCGSKDILKNAPSLMY